MIEKVVADFELDKVIELCDQVRRGLPVIKRRGIENPIALLTQTAVGQNVAVAEAENLAVSGNKSAERAAVTST